MVKFSPTALSFSYDFVLLLHFLGHLYIKKIMRSVGFTAKDVVFALQTHLPSDPSVPIHLLCPHLSSSQRPITHFLSCSARSSPQASCLLPLFFQSSPFSSTLLRTETPAVHLPAFFVTFIVPFDLFTLAFRRQGLRFYPRHPQPQAIIHILCRQV